MVDLTVFAADEQEMLELGVTLSRACLSAPGASDSSLVVYLQGNLGMGKTTISRGVLRGFDHEGAVKSPTYTLVEPYRLEKADIYHFDLYRLGDPEELEYMGIRDYFFPEQQGKLSLCLVEWPDCGAGYLPSADIVVDISVEQPGRTLQLSALSERGKGVLKQQVLACRY